jgi:hypothetical protein
MYPKLDPEFVGVTNTERDGSLPGHDDAVKSRTPDVCRVRVEKAVMAGLDPAISLQNQIRGLILGSG